MYYKIDIKKSYVSNLNGNTYELSLATPTEDATDSAALYRTLKSEGNGEAGVYTLSSVQVTKQLSAPNHIAVEMTISGLSFSSISALKENLRLRFIDSQVALSFVYSQVYSSSKELELATNYRVIGVGLSNIKGSLSSATVSVKLDIYSPDKYATLNRHSEVFVGRQLGEIMSTALSKFEYLEDAYNDKSTIARTHNFFYSYDEGDSEVKYEKQEDKDIEDKTAETITSIYKVSKSVRKMIVPHIIPYSVQYNESTYDYLCRLCRRFGETLYYENGELRIGVQPINVEALSLASVFSNISFNETADSASTMYVGGNYLTNSTNVFSVGGSAETAKFSVENQEVGTDEDYVDLLSTVDTAWAEDNPQLDDYYLDYLGETDGCEDDIVQEERYNIVTNSIVYWPAIVVRLLSQILSFKLTEMEKTGEFIFENVMSIYESYRLVGEINEEYLEHIETVEYPSRCRYYIDSDLEYEESWIKSSSNTNPDEKGECIISPSVEDIAASSGVEVKDTMSTGQEPDSDGNPVTTETSTKKATEGVRYVDSPRGLAEIMYRSNFALTSFITKTSAESGRNSLTVTLQTLDDPDSNMMSVISAMRLGSVVTLDHSTDDVQAPRYVVSGVRVYNVSSTTATVNVPESTSGDSVDSEFVSEPTSSIVGVDYSVEVTPVVELDLIPCVTTTYTKVIGASETATDQKLEVAIPYFTPDDMIRRAEPQRAFVVDVNDSHKLNRARVCYPWQYGAGAGADTSNESITALTRDTTLSENLKKGASPWLRVSTPVNNGGSNGFIASPALHSEVMVSYESGNVERPYISGSLFSGPSPVLLGHQIADNSIFSSQYGRKILLSDVAVGGNNSILTSLFPFTSMLGLDSSGAVAEMMDGYIQIGDTYGLCSINLSSTKRAVSISSPMGSVNISALTGINIVAPSGDINISGKNVNIMAENNLNIMSGTRVGRMRKFSAEYSGKSIKHKILTAMTGVVKGGIEAGLGEIIDLSLIRTLFECFVAPVGGTMVIKSNRYMCIEGGVGRTNMPESTNNKCYISEVLSGYLRLFDPLDGWRALRYQKCYSGLKKELLGENKQDKKGLIFKYYSYNNTLNSSGSSMWDYINERIVAPGDFPANGNHTFEEGNNGYGQWLKELAVAAAGEAPEGETAEDRNVREAGLRSGYESAPSGPESLSLRYKLMMMRHSFNDYLQFVNESTSYHVTDSNKGSKFMQKRIDAIPEKFGVTEGIKNIITRTLFGGETPTYATIKGGVADNADNEYPLLKQALFGEPAAKMAAKRILLLMLLRQISAATLEKYDIDGAVDINEDILFGDMTAQIVVGRNEETGTDIMANTILGVFNGYIPNNGVAVSIKAKAELAAGDITIVNRDWATLCNNFKLDNTKMSKSGIVESKAKSAGLFALKAIGLDPVAARDSIIPWSAVKSDRRTSDSGAILISTMPNSTMRFNSNTATFDKVGTTENAVVAAFKAALLSV